MPENTAEFTAMLVNLAAEGIAEVIKGCALTVSSARHAGVAGMLEAPPPKAIAYFGPRIVERWLQGLNEKTKEEQLEAIVQLAALPVNESRREATAAVERVAASASTEDKTIAIEYLSVIPLSVRRALVHNPDTGKMSLPTQFLQDDGVALIRLLPSDVPPFPVGSDLPGTTYVLEELLGIGGFGAVYKAKNRCEQHQPARAIKFCLEPSMLATLHRERATLDRLMALDSTKWSTRIVRLYGHALDANPPFLVYEYVAGGDLTSNLRVAREKTGRGFRPALALELIRQVAEALSFAHNQGLVHRDLKPANVLVSGSKIKLTDFGIGGVVATHAVRSGNSVAGSMGNSVSAADQATFFRGSGTPLYMSPEQRRGDQPDPRHDLYSLGVMWYQLIVGDVSRELHPGWTDELMEEFQTPKGHIDLILKCVGYFKKRPVNAAELLGLMPPPSTKADGSLNSENSVSKADIALPPDTGPGPLSSGSIKPPTELDKLKAKLADFVEHDALTEAFDTVSAILKLDPADTEAIEVRGFLQQRLSESGIVEMFVFREHRHWVRCVAVSPDGRLAVSGSDDQSLILWDLENCRPVRDFIGHAAAVMGVAFSPDGRRILSASWDATVRLWDADTGRELRDYTGPWKAVKTVAYSPDKASLLLSADDNKLHLFEVDSGTLVGSLTGHTDLVQSVAFSASGAQAISGGDDGSVRVWDLDSGKELRCFTGHTDSVTSVAFAPNGRWVFSGSSDNTARLWDVQTGKELRLFAGHSNWVNSVAFSPKALHVLSGSGGEIVNDKFDHGSDTSVRLWDLQNEKELMRYIGHEASVTCVAFTPDGQHIVSGSLDKTVRLLEIPEK